MGKTHLILMICFLAIAVPSFAADDCSGNLAKDRDHNLICLERLINQPKTGIQDWERFWRFYNSAEKEALRCDSLAFTANFLKIGTYDLGTGTDEAYSTTVDRLFRTQTSCFFNAILILNDNQRRSVISRLVPPISNTMQKAVDDVFNSKSGIRRYQEITNIYKEIRSKRSDLE